MAADINYSTLGKVRKIIKSVAAYDNRIADLLERADASKIEAYTIDNELQQIQLGLLYTANRLMKAVTNNIMQTSPDSTETFNKISETICLDARVYAGNLYVRVPYPPHRYAETFSGFSYYLSNTISRVLEDLNRPKKKVVCIINVYGKSKEFSNEGIVDFDNIDYKNLIDEVCRPYYRSDSPATTSLYFNSYFTDELLPMTYVVVLDMAEYSALSDKNLRNNLIRIWTEGKSLQTNSGES